MRTYVASAVLMLGLLLSIVRNADGEPILDQSLEMITGRFTGIAPGTSGAQTFTVGIAGVLTRVDVFIERNGFADLRFDLRPTTVEGAPVEDDEMVLASIIRPADAIPFPGAFLSFDVTPVGISVSEGQVLAIVLSGNARWSGVPNDAYPRGTAFFRGSGEIFRPIFDDFDGAFRTFVDPIPEPATALLIGTGLAAVGTALLKRRAK